MYQYNKYFIKKQESLVAIAGGSWRGTKNHPLEIQENQKFDEGHYRLKGPIEVYP